MASMGNGGNALRNDQKGGLADEKSLLSTISTLWACSNAAPKPKPFFKNIPRRIFKDQRNAEGVPFRRDPLYPLNEFEAVIRSRWVEFVP